MPSLTQGGRHRKAQALPLPRMVRSKTGRQYGEMGGALENVACAGEECQELREEIEHLSEKQEVWATLMEGKMSMQKVAREKYQEKIFEVTGVGGEDDRSFGAREAQAQVGKMGR